MAALQEKNEATGAADSRRLLLDISAFRLAGNAKQNGKRREMSLVIPWLQLHAGQVSAVIGGSGCGKSVLLSLVMGYPSFGIGGTCSLDEFRLFGEEIPKTAFRRTEHTALWRRKINRTGGLFYLPQTFPLAKVRGGDTRSAMVQVVQAMAAPTRISARDVDCRLVETFKGHCIHDVLAKTLNDLSGGERRRAELLARLVAMQVAARPAILVLDEPTTGFDPANALRFIRDVRAIIDGLNDAGIPSAALLSTHEMRSLDDRMDDGHRVIDRICIVNRDSDGVGSGDCTIIFDGSPTDVFPKFFGLESDITNRTFARDGEELFERIRKRTSSEWVDHWMSDETEEGDHVS